MRYTISIAATFICDLVLLFVSPALWLAIHLTGDLGLSWLLKHSVEVDNG